MSRILIVEDESHLADGLRFNLEAEGYEVEIAPYFYRYPGTLSPACADRVVARASEMLESLWA